MVTQDGGGSVSQHDSGRFDKLVKRARSTVGLDLDSLLITVDKRIQKKAVSILTCETHPLRSILLAQRSPRSGRFVTMNCSTERLRRTFIPHALRLFTEQKMGYFIEDEDSTVSILMFILTLSFICRSYLLGCECMYAWYRWCVCCWIECAHVYLIILFWHGCLRVLRLTEHDLWWVSN